MHEEEVHARRDATVVVPRPVAPRKSVASTMASLRFCSSAAAKAIIDRYYRTLYASLHDARLASSAKQAMYLNLLFKSLKADTSSERVKAMVKRLVQLLAAGGNGATEFVAGGLYLLGQVGSEGNAPYVQCSHFG